VSAALGTLALASLAGIAFALATSLALELVWPGLRRGLDRRHPAARARMAWAVATAPGVAPVVLVGLCFAPGVLGWLGLHADHCVHHAGHPHLCLVHATARLTPELALVLVGALALLAAVAWSPLRRVARARRALADLRAGSARALAPGVRCVESQRPFSLTAGLGRGEIFVSSALVEALGPEALEVVIAHERAHGRRRDGLRRLAAQALSWPLRPTLRREVLAELAVATERACDEAAARGVGDRVRVAEVIVIVERLLAAWPSSPAPDTLAFGGSAVPTRVRALLSAPAPGAGRAGPGALAVLVVVGFVLPDPLHHATEHLLGLLLGTH